MGLIEIKKPTSNYTNYTNRKERFLLNVQVQRYVVINVIKWLRGVHNITTDVC